MILILVEPNQLCLGVGRKHLSLKLLQQTPHRPLLWFGLLEYRSEKIPDTQFAERYYYRKAPLFDRLLAFDVEMDFAGGPRH